MWLGRLNSKKQLQFQRQSTNTIRTGIFVDRTVLILRSCDFFFYFTALKNSEINSFFRVLGEQIVALRPAILNGPDLPLGFG